jgi:hypothetical protein
VTTVVEAALVSVLASVVAATEPVSDVGGKLVVTVPGAESGGVSGGRGIVEATAIDDVTAPSVSAGVLHAATTTATSADSAVRQFLVTAA